MLEAIELSKSFGENLALDSLTLTVKPGDIYCLLGANGAGKTTTINLFLGFIQPTDGLARIDGLDVASEPLKTKRLIAYIPENLVLYPLLTGLENLRYFAQLGGQDSYTDEEYLAFLEVAGLDTDDSRRAVRGYSKGMRQKVGIAIALAKKARALLLDEPTSGLDPKASNEFAELLLELRNQGKAVLMATHDLFRAKESGTRLGIMRQGRLVRELDSAEVSHADIERIYLEHMRE